MPKDISQERLKELLSYDKDSGLFKRKTKNGKPSQYGVYAGCCSTHGYVSIGVDGSQYLAHRLAWLYIHGEWPNEIDHINHKREDNRICNLANVTRAENMKNKKLLDSCKHGHPGIHKKKSGWVAHIAGKSLGVFKLKRDAIHARKEAERLAGYHPNHGKKLDYNDLE